MTAPTNLVRMGMYDRDSNRCASCGRLAPLQHQHRASTGMGGSQIRPDLAESLTSCALCNPAYEHVRQTEALAHGWKIRKWVPDRVGAAAVPVFYAPDIAWYRLFPDRAYRELISPAVAQRMMLDVYGDQWTEWMRKAA